MYTENNSLKIKNENMEISYDFRIEAVYCLLTLSNYTVLSPYSKEYQMIIKKEFGHINSNWLGYFTSISQNTFRFVIPCVLALSTSYINGTIIQSDKLKGEYEKRLGGQKSIDEIIEKINEFIRESNFDDFFHKHRNLYSSYMENYKNILFDVMKDTQQWYNDYSTEYKVYISQLVHPGGFGIRLNKQNDAVCVVGSLLNSDYSINDALSYNVYFHEFSHHFIDKFISDNWDIIVQHMNNTYDNNNSFETMCQQELFCESIIRALTNYYCFIKSKDINLNDFEQYPYSKQLFMQLKEIMPQNANNKVLDILLFKLISLMNED
jgi:hypothetical protein